MKKLIIFTISFICGLAANAQIVNSSKFKPFRYDEMMAPLLAVQQFHKECCQTLIQLMDSAKEVEEYINPEKDSVSWSHYTNYYNSVVDEYNEINKNGTNQGTRQRIYNLRKNFSVINAIVHAYNRRAKMANDQYQRLQSSPNIRCDKFYSDYSVDDFLDGKTPVVNYTYDNNEKHSSLSQSNKTYSTSSPNVRFTKATRLKIKNISKTNTETKIEFEDNSAFFEWSTISPNSYILVNGKKYKMRRAKGIGVSPAKRYFDVPNTVYNFTLYFPCIPKTATSLDFIEPGGSDWKFYGVELK